MLQTVIDSSVFDFFNLTCFIQGREKDPEAQRKDVGLAVTTCRCYLRLINFFNAPGHWF